MNWKATAQKALLGGAAIIDLVSLGVSSQASAEAFHKALQDLQINSIPSAQQEEYEKLTRALEDEYGIK